MRPAARHPIQLRDDAAHPVEHAGGISPGSVWLTVRVARLGEVDDLGELEVGEREDGVTRIGWEAYEGFSRCFSSYRVTFGAGGSPTAVLAVISGQQVTELETDALHPETTYALRVQAVRVTTLGSFPVAESEIASFTLP